MAAESKRASTSSSSSSSSQNKRRKSGDKNRDDTTIIQSLKHYDIFYGQAPPGLIQEEKERPEDCIPDRPENKDAREFLAKAPTKGLWMPLGKEVKVMKCWRCKAYGHRTGDRECPLFLSGNAQIEKFRFIHEDPMHNFINEQVRTEKEERVRQLQALLNSPTSSSSSSSDSDSSSSSSSDSSSSSSSTTHKKRGYKKHRSSSKKKSSSSKKRKKKSHSHKKKKRQRKKHKSE